MTVQGSSQMLGTGTCSITGKVVPEDELVTIHGQLVCAEGKAILLARLRAGDALPGELEHPTALRRFLCISLDGVIVGFCAGFLNGINAALGASPIVQDAIAIFVTFAQIIYFGQMHASYGQTIGKMAGKIVVVNLDGSPISTFTAYIRALASAGPGLLGWVPVVIGNPGLILASGGVSTCWFFIDAAFALIDRSQQRSLHDRIAGTRVVMKG